MRLIEGLHVTRIRRLKWEMRRRDGRATADRFYTSAKTVNALVWILGLDEMADEMWAAHTEAMLRQKDMEKLTREVSA